VSLREKARAALERARWLLPGTLLSGVPPYYRPVPEAADLPPDHWEREVGMVGVEIDEAVVRGFVEGVVTPHLAEFRALHPLRSSARPGEGLWLLNGSYMAVDAQVLHGVVRALRPRRIVEIGSGASTRFIEAALRLNREAGAPPCRHLSVDPYPSPWLRGVDPSLVSVRTEKVQDVPLALFEELDRDDVLFIDSSHVVREGNDVLFEYMEVLPRLRPGVLVHVHDVSLPRRYPRVYFENRLYWTEQYLLKAYLTHNARVEVVWPGAYMDVRHPGYVEATFPEVRNMKAAFPSSEPTAFWYRVR
jgi:hypothetical protein